MRYGTDPALKGDIQIVARGVSGLLAKEAAQQRRNEFLNIALNSPVAQNIIGPEGVAYLLRTMADTLEMNRDELVPPDEVIRQRMAEQQQAMMMQAAAEGKAPAGPPGQPTPPAPPGPGQTLADGTPVTDLHAPTPK
jgi:hypothetical protein